MSGTRPLMKERETTILDAAQRRFARFGIGKVTMDEIASDVGLGKASLYYYFRTKDDVLRGVLEREQREFVSALGAILLRDTSASDKLKHFARRRLELFGELLNLAQFKNDAWAVLHPKFRPLFRAVEEEELGFLTRILRDGSRSGELRIAHVDRTAALLLHVFHGMRLRVVKQSETPSESASNYAELVRDVDQLLDLLLAGMTAGIHPSHSIHRNRHE
jgi:TetR/AcrR family transcriptional regulator